MNVLILEDDPMVEFIHRSYLEKMAIFDNIYSTNTVSNAIDYLQKQTVDLLLLDIHLKNENGLDCLMMIRQQKLPIDVILITAADELQTVQEGLRLGVIDYLLKPFTHERFEKSIQLFLEKHALLSEEKTTQDTIDHLTNQTTKHQVKDLVLDKGLSQQTMDHILSIIKSNPKSFTIQELADKCQLSHVSIRKYVTFLEEHHLVTSKTVYTKVGRPFKEYYFNQ
ncbi:response regulator [Vagococcus jeotgali]|uniref:response regulator n=1 Tax=Vagococcus jeotgali TaxID=3109030 RepID=UPI002DDBE615|nr:response regulator [Vagococcus sp. B2T-5]